MAGFKDFKDSIMFLFGGNVTGYKWKFFVIWCCENHRSFKHIKRYILQVCYRDNKKTWMAQLLFQDALLYCYVCKMERNCLENNMLLDTTLLLLVFILTSKWFFFLWTAPIWSNQWTKELEQLLRPTTCRGSLPTYCLKWERNWEDTEANLEGLHLWQHK